jgi:uridine kinase
MSASEITIENLIETVKQRPSSGDPQIISIIGGSASGKTTIATVLQETLGEDSMLVSQDLFQLGREFLDRKTSVYKWDDPRNFAIEECEQVLGRLKTGVNVTAPKFEVVENIRIGTVDINPRPYVIWEGVYANLTPRLRELIDVSVYIDTPFPVRFIRRISRFIDSRPVSVDVDYSTPVRQMLTFVLRAENDFSKEQLAYADYSIAYDWASIDEEVSHLIASAGALPEPYRTFKDAAVIDSVEWRGLVFTLKEAFFEISQSGICMYSAPIDENDVDYIKNTFKEAIGR